MVIEHIAMYVNDLEMARDFFVDFLGGKSNAGYHDEDYQKNYLIGKYGAIPNLKGFEGVFS